MAPLISALNIYPVKSCRGVSVPQAVLTEAGFRWDREWMVVKEESGKFVTIRQDARLALVVPSLPADALTADTAGLPSDASLTLTAPGLPAPLSIPLAPPQKRSLRNVEIWEWKGSAHDEGDAAAAWFTQYLGVPSRLVRYLGSKAGPEVPDVVRPTDTEFAPGHEVRFADAFPILLASEGALDDLNKRLATEGYSPVPPAPSLPLTMARFRPNLVVGGTGAWEEDKWSVLRVNAEGGAPVELTAVKPCDRCKVPTIDPSTAEKSGGEPFDVLTTFRKGSQLGYSVKKWTHAVFFGQNMVVAGQDIGRVLKVGDAIEFHTPAKVW